jgi:hypothetical protein
MDAWLQLVRLGDPELTLPGAAGISAWLMVARAWRMAFWWSLLFGCAVALVAASKIVFLGWGGGWHALGYKALSGHATGATALFPMLFYLLLRGHSLRWRAAGVAGGLALGALLVVALTASCEHSWSEALAGWCAGAAASLGALSLAWSLPLLRPVQGMLAFLLVFCAGAWLMQWAHLGWWMIKAARLLSGNTNVFDLTIN